MCGIAGSFGSSLVPPEGVGADVRNVLAHRGPDGFGWWQEGQVSLLHWRLSVIELSDAGSQPMMSHDGRFVLTYNGEVYNFEELRRAVEAQWRGEDPAAAHHEPAEPPVRSWRGRSDTEVLVEGLALWGPEFLTRLDGMFALALYDRETGRLHVARDRAGIKPLYVWAREDLVLFASEAKFFFLAPGFTPRIDARGLAAFFTYGQCHDDEHILAGVRQLEPGELLTIERLEESGSPTLRRTRFAHRPRWRPVARSDSEAAAAVRQLLEKVVARQLVADVPVGVLLSGGVDSSILAALAARHLGAPSTHAFTLGYPGMGADFDEIGPARRVASHLGIRHHVCEASQADLIAELERLAWHYDEPFGDAAALNILVLSRMIRSRVTVALAGEGSDELFGGYRRYHVEKIMRALGPAGKAACSILRSARADRASHVPRRLGVALRALVRPSAPARYSAYLESDVPAGVVLKPEWHRVVSVHSAIREGYPNELEGGTVASLCLVDQQFWLPSTYLEKTDKGSMAHGLEVRVPFLDNEVVEFANSLPEAQRIRGLTRKWLLRRAFADLLPREVFQRFKRGFGVPVGRWLRKELREYYIDRVLSPGAFAGEYLRMPVVEACFREHVRGARDHTGLLWKCLMLECWLGNYHRQFRSMSPEDEPRGSRPIAAVAARSPVAPWPAC